MKIFTFAITQSQMNRYGDFSDEFEAKTAVGTKERDDILKEIVSRAVYESQYLEYHLSEMLFEINNEKFEKIFLGKLAKEFSSVSEIEKVINEYSREDIFNKLHENYSVKEICESKFVEYTDFKYKITERKL